MLELMAALAIIGILAAIAGPYYVLYGARARQGEARAALAAIYAAEQAAHTEYLTYTCCLYQIGYHPSLGERYYLTGFFGGFAGQPCNWTYNSNTACSSTQVSWGGSVRSDATFWMNKWANDALSSSGDATPNGTFASNRFTALAFGSVLGRSSNFDVWTIDQGNIMVHVQSGL